MNPALPEGSSTDPSPSPAPYASITTSLDIEVTSGTANSTDISSAEPTADAYSTATTVQPVFEVILPPVGSGVAETIEDCPILGSNSGMFSQFVDSPQGLPDCDAASARYVYSSWQACVDEELEEPINCSDPRIHQQDASSSDSLVRTQTTNYKRVLSVLPHLHHACQP